MKRKQCERVLIILAVIYLVTDTFLSFRYIAPAPPINVSTKNIGGSLTSFYEAPNPGRNAADESLCVLVRTYSGHGVGLLSLLYSLSHGMEQEFSTDDRIQRLNVIVTDTQYGKDHDSSAAIVKSLVQEVAASIQHRAALRTSLFLFEKPPQFQAAQQNYGYDITNMMLDHIITRSSLECDRFMFTNGDNSYGGSIIRSVNDWIKEPARDTHLIGMYFVTHYTRKKRRNRLKETKFVESMVDLGSVVVKEAAITSLCKSTVMFPVGEFTADWLFFQKIMSCHGTTSVIPEVLLLHN